MKCLLYSHRVRCILFLILSFDFLIAELQAASPSSFGECIPATTNLTSFHCKPARKENAIVCKDSNDLCSNWASRGECQKNPNYMLRDCAKSCDACVNIHAGVTQIAPDESIREQVHERLLQAQRYLHAKVAEHVRHLDSCQNRHELCTEWAVRGECSKNPSMMQNECGPACQTC